MKTEFPFLLRWVLLTAKGTEFCRPLNETNHYALQFYLIVMRRDGCSPPVRVSRTTRSRLSGE